MRECLLRIEGARPIVVELLGVVGREVMAVAVGAKIRLINARGYGHHSAASLKAMIYLNLGGIEVKLPTQR